MSSIRTIRNNPLKLISVWTHGKYVLTLLSILEKRTPPKENFPFGLDMGNNNWASPQQLDTWK